MTTAEDFLEEAQRLGCVVLTSGDRVGLRGPQAAVAQLTPHLRLHKPALLRLLPGPYIDTHGDLVVPFGSDPAACWWLGGKTIDEVLDDLDAPEDTRCRYRYKH